jgi:hypothetical protein
MAAPRALEGRTAVITGANHGCVAARRSIAVPASSSTATEDTREIVLPTGEPEKRQVILVIPAGT